MSPHVQSFLRQAPFPQYRITNATWGYWYGNVAIPCASPASRQRL